MEPDAFERAGVWAVRIVTDQVAGFILYGSAVAENGDRILGDGEHVWVFPTLGHLSEFILANASVTTVMPGYAELREAVIRNRNLWADEDDETAECRLSHASRVLHSGTPLPYLEVGPLVDCVNMLWDLCWSVEMSAVALESLRNDTMLRRLVDELTFLEPNGDVTLSPEEVEQATRQYDSLLAKVIPRLSMNRG